jgi:hypothetical protein
VYKIENVDTDVYSAATARIAEDLSKELPVLSWRFILAGLARNPVRATHTFVTVLNLD